ncbi:MAG: prepilin peptidase [Patescibacteria group bacterium]|nr:prepilin peptidase [Patescibacteria group bacterium]
MILFLFVLGLVVGSFLNVVGLRWGTGQTLLGRSHCPSCNKILKWWELVPIVSFFVLKARCRECQVKISWQYPTVEILTGLVFATIFNLQFSILQNLLFLTIFCIYIVIVIYDIRHKIIPDELVYVAIFLSLLIPLFFVSYATLDWLSGPILFAFFGLIWLFSRGRAMGFGDAKLGLSVGFLLGASQGFSAIILAFWIGAFVSLLYIFLNKTGLLTGKAGFLKNAEKLTMKSEIPFAPFIVAGAWMSLVFHLNIFYVALF